jgi:DNA-directed RNA polymerase subunit beta
MATYKRLSRPSGDTDRTISESIAKKVKEMFPIEGNFFILNVSNISIEKGNAGIIGVKKAIVSGSTISNRVKATVSLFEKSTKKVIDTKRRVIMSIPAFTDKGSFVVEGNSYTIPLQQRLRHGVYTLKKRNGAIETMFNLDRGRNFTLKINGESFTVKVGSAHVSLYSLLYFLGVSEDKMKKTWGEDMFQANKKTYKSSDAEKFMQLFSYDNAKPSTNPTQDVRDAIQSAQVSAAVVKETLGIDSSTINGEMLLAASMRLVKVFNGKEEPDDRENMMFKKVITPEHMLSEAFDKSKREIVSKIKFKLSNPRTMSVDDTLGQGGVLLGRPIKTFVVSSDASLMPEEYNPVMMHMSNHLITPLGEGGIGDTRALNLDTKAVHASHLGFIDPIVSPEGASVGITLAVTGNAYVDETGNPAIKVLNAKNGKEEIVPLDVLWKKRVAYPISKERIKTDGVMVRVGNKDMKAKSKKDVDYIMLKASDMHAPSSNLVALGNSMDANRFNMGQKHIQQALSISQREPPNVSVGDEYGESANTIAVDSGHIPSTKKGGTVVDVKPEYIKVKAKDGTTEKIEYVRHLPLARKTFIDHKLVVKKGDQLKQGQHIADSNFTKDGKMALGKNVRVAWLSMRGNRNDGVVVSESASEMFTSEHMYKENIDIDPTDIQDFQRFAQLFPKEVAKWGAKNYDAKGVIKKGKTLLFHQPMAFILKQSDPSQLKSKLERVMFAPYKAKIITWHHKDDGEVIEANAKGGEVRLNIKVKSPMRVGDKMSGRYGNKGIVTRVLPDEHMPKNTKGERVEVSVTAAGVISRTNGASLIEAGLGKVVEKTNKRYILPHYEKEDNLEFMEEEAKKHKVELYETLINPKTGKPFPQKVFVGNAHMMKLFKDGESGMAAVGVGSTDINEQPTKGGKNSAASYSNMETNSLLAYGAHSLLSEAKHIKSQKNDEFFDAFRRGLPPPPPAENFASAKFKAYLEQMAADVIVDRHTGEYSMLPMNDKDIVRKSSGKIKNADTIYAKNGKPVKGGLFDEVIFGGASGSRSSHIDLGTKILNPIYKEHVARMLGISTSELIKRIETKGLDPIIKSISKIKPKAEVTRLKKEIISSNNPQIANRNIKTIKMLEKTIDLGKTPKNIMFLSKIPVIAPIYRPASKDSKGDISINDLNLHYQDVFAMSEAVKKSGVLTKKTSLQLKSELYKSVGALYGIEESPNKKIRDKKVKGVLDILSGGQPKESYAQQKLLRVKQFMSGRAVIVPARRDIGIDQLEVPEAMGLEMYEPHISRIMSRKGYSPLETKELIEAKDAKVIKIMKDIGKDIPVAYNRAPTLWKHGILGGYPIFTKGTVIGLNPLTETALASDYDGDQVSTHVPISQSAIEDIKTKMMPSQNLFSDRLSYENPHLLQMPDQDATLGIYKASIGKKERKPILVQSIAVLREKIRIGEIHYSDYVKVG